MSFICFRFLQPMGFGSNLLESFKMPYSFLTVLTGLELTAGEPFNHLHEHTQTFEIHHLSGFVSNASILSLPPIFYIHWLQKSSVHMAQLLIPTHKSHCLTQTTGKQQRMSWNSSRMDIYLILRVLLYTLQLGLIRKLVAFPYINVPKVQIVPKVEFMLRFVHICQNLEPQFGISRHHSLILFCNTTFLYVFLLLR